MVDEDSILYKDISQLLDIIQIQSSERQRCIRAALATVFHRDLSIFIRNTVRDIRNLKKPGYDRAPSQEELLMPRKALEDFVESGENRLEIMEECIRLLSESRIECFDDLFLEYGFALRRQKEISQPENQDNSAIKRFKAEKLAEAEKAFELADIAFPEIEGLEIQAQTHEISLLAGAEFRWARKQTIH